MCATKSAKFVACLIILDFALKVMADEPGDVPKATGQSMHGAAAGDVREDNGLKLKLIWCPPGFVRMEQVEVIDEKGNAAEDDPFGAEKITIVKAFISRGYWIGKFEVTRTEWTQVMETEPWKGKPMKAIASVWIDCNCDQFEDAQNSDQNLGEWE
jgi:formylglycine-generating enzyme required for sulfatase activity